MTERRNSRIKAICAAGAVLALAATSAAASPGSERPGAAEAGPSPELTGRMLVALDLPPLPPGDGEAATEVREARIDRAAGLIERVASRQEVKVRGADAIGGLFAVRPGLGEDAGDLRAQLLADPLVERVYPEPYLQLRALEARAPHVPNDPAYLSTDPNMPNNDRRQWNLIKSNFESAWGLSNGSGATVAIADTGIDGGHPDLGSQISTAVDQDQTAPTGATNDENGHGTHVAGLACGNSDNGYGVASAGFDCRLLIEKLDVTGNNLDLLSIIRAVNDAANKGADVLNLSLGGAGNTADLRNAINLAWARDVVIVAAASNSSIADQEYPAKFVQPQGTASNPGTCNAGDTTSFGCARGLVVTMAGYTGANAFAGYGTGVSVAAYGDPLPPYQGLFSTWPGNVTFRDTGGFLNNPPPCTCRTTFNGDDRYAYLFGTSMATPQVAGLAALIRSLYPNMSAGEVVKTIKLSASRKGTWSSDLGFGIIDGGAALALSVVEGDTRAPSSKVKSGNTSSRRRFRLSISSSDKDPAGKPPSGVDEVEVYVSKNGRRFHLYKTTAKAKLRFRGARGSSYRFYSRAVDKAGNREAAPKGADSITRVLSRR